MSRGLGKLQRDVLRCLEPDHVMCILEIAAQTHGPTITRAEYECVRRALHSLERRGLIGKTWWAEGVDIVRWALTAEADRLFDRFCEIMDRIERKRCMPANPTHNPPDKRCGSGESNTYEAA